MTTVPFDTLRAAQALRDAGFDDAQSEAIVATIQKSLGENVATKSDLFAVKSDLETKLVELRADIYRALWIQGGVLGTIMLGIATVAVAIIALIIA